jgi:long-chain acyl-CoA synthetase
MNLANFAWRAACLYGNRPAVALGERTVSTYADLYVRIAALAGALRSHFGLAEGDRVALIMRNTPEYVELLFACWHAGLVAVPVNAKLHADEIAYVMENSGARLCFVSEDLQVSVAGDDPDVSLITVGSADYERLLNAEPAPIADVAAAQTAWLFYTSGTTGKPKGAMLTHENLRAMMLCYFADVDSVSPTDSILHAAPMSHGSGLYILPHVLQGACNVIPESGGFDATEVYSLLSAHTDVAFFAAPTMVKRLVAAAGGARGIENLKTLVYGGGPMYQADIAAAHEALGFRLAQIYGQGESPMTITALNKFHHGNTQHPRYAERLNSVGVTQALVEVRIAGGNDEPISVGETGEVLVRGPSVIPGYWQNQPASEETLRGGWLHTGDLGIMDSDGFLTLVDRAKDLIISGGANIYPREVEEVLLRHPQVGEVAVVGHEDDEWGERVVAFVVGDDKISIDELDRFCLQHMARFKRPRDYRFVDALPKNNYGKVLKRELRHSLET